MSAATKTILVVDDEPGYLALLTYELTNRGFVVVTALGGPAAIEVAKNTKVDLLITDMQMPVMDGLETAQALREILPGLPAIMVTGYAKEELVQKFLELEATSYLRKPFEIDALINQINIYIPRSQRPLESIC